MATSSDNLGLATALAISALGLFRAGCFLARFVLNSTNSLLDGALDLVLDRRLALLGLSDASGGGLAGDGLLGCGGGALLAADRRLATRFRGHGGEDAWLGVAGGGAGGGHCDVGKWVV